MRDGATPTVVCVHGAGGGGWEWSVWARAFAAAGFAVVAPDLQPAADGLAATRFADYREQVLRWCEAAGAGVVLAGASLGGLLALACAEDAAATALVLVNPLPPRAGPARALREPHPPVVPWGRQRSITSTRRAMSDADDAACLYALRRWRDESGAVLDDAVAGIAVAAPACPTLVLASALDEDVPPAQSRAMAAEFGADFVLIERATHVGPLLGRGAAEIAAQASIWLRARLRSAARARA